MRQLVLEPMGGLGNRIRAINSGAALADELGASLRVVWRVDRDLAAPFDALFERPARIDGVHSIDLMALERDAYFPTLRAYALSLGPDHFLDRPSVENLAPDAIRRLGLGPEGVLYVRTWDRFRPAPKRITLFSPVPALRADIERTVDRFDETIGVHIRRTDNARSTAVSSTELFVTRMSRAIRHGEARTFFLATDDPRERQVLGDRFPGLILGRAIDSFDRSEPAAAADAVVDLFCLARTRRLFGSHYSSFSEVAAGLGAIPREVMKGA